MKPGLPQIGLQFSRCGRLAEARHRHSLKHFCTGQGNRLSSCCGRMAGEPQERRCRRSLPISPYGLANAVSYNLFLEPEWARRRVSIFRNEQSFFLLWRRAGFAFARQG